MSLARLVTRATFTPGPSSSSNRVTVGPTVWPSRRVSTPCAARALTRARPAALISSPVELLELRARQQLHGGETPVARWPHAASIDRAAPRRRAAAATAGDRRLVAPDLDERMSATGLGLGRRLDLGLDGDGRLGARASRRGRTARGCHHGAAARDRRSAPRGSGRRRGRRHRRRRRASAASPWGTAVSHSTRTECGPRRPAPPEGHPREEHEGQGHEGEKDDRRPPVAEARAQRDCRRRPR